MLFSNVVSYGLCKYIWKRFWTLVRNINILASVRYLNPLYSKSRKGAAFLYRIKANLFQKYFWGLRFRICYVYCTTNPVAYYGNRLFGFFYETRFFYILITTFYCFFCVGFAEELIFRGFLFKKTLDICRIKWISIVINIILFYVIHWTSLPHNFGGFYNIAINTLILCIYYLLRTEKTLIPLMVGHGFYDTLTSVILPILIYMNN